MDMQQDGAREATVGDDGNGADCADTEDGGLVGTDAVGADAISANGGDSGNGSADANDGGVVGTDDGGCGSGRNGNDKESDLA